jgi:hypothetical protein
MTLDREPIRAGDIGSAVARDLPAAGAGDALDDRGGAVPPLPQPAIRWPARFYLGLALLAPTFWMVVLFPAAVLLVLWGAIHPEDRFLHERFGARTTTRGACVAGCDYDRLATRTAGGTFCRRSNAVAPALRMASSDLDVVSRNRVFGASDPDETGLVVTGV